MRLSPFALLMGLSALVKASGETLVTRESDDWEEQEPLVPTVFNGVTVPPMLELDPSNYKDEIAKSKYLVIKHYSPYCPHCIDFAPTFQTLYEYYYTSKPKAAGSSSFTDYYDLRFAMLNCIAYQDLCLSHDVNTYPQTIIFENGKEFTRIRGAKQIGVISELVEKALEEAKPGSRPTTVKLPEPGDKEFPKRAPSKEDEEDSTTKSSSKTSTTEEDDDSTEEDSKKHDTSVIHKDDMESISDEHLEDLSDTLDDILSEKPKKVSDETKSTGREWPQKWKGVTAAEVFNIRKPKKPLNPPNENGASVPLTAESFQRLVTMTQDPWFVKFYAPWCHHCQALAPTWSSLAKSMQGKLNIGEVNCDVERSLCKDVKARAYPTILFFKGGERSEYQGLRGLGDFVQYADNAIDLAGGVPDVTAEEFEALEKKEEVVFVYFYDHATTTEDFVALERIPLSLIGHAKLVKTQDPALYKRFKISTWPRLLVSREGRPTYFTPLTPNEMRDVPRVLDWMKSVWLPLVPELTAMNARQIMDGKIVVLGILNRKNADGFQGALRELKSAANEWMDRQIQEFQLERKKLRDAKQMRIEEAEDRDDERALRSAKTIRIDMNNSGKKEVAFAWVDGVFWQRWIRTTFGIDSTLGDRVIINDQDSRQYWDNTVTGNYIMVSRTAISESLDKIIYGRNVIKPKLAVSIFEKALLDIRVTFVEHPYLSSGCVVGVLFGLFTIFKGRFRRRAGYFKLDEPKGSFKDGILGQNGYTKAD
ncbi:hypothetical protein V2G26_006686 [Clonostachys chloroleuca]|uniref:Thioredoxin domain-containing protein n=1 Tax=Clonostachys chloroleuca TaxID=1926264 RepID=A0AA35M3L2_9HYPO|nr:unnamed protein product [Clonostachys chloroleuca]